MSQEIEIIPVEALRDRAKTMREHGARLVQVSATRLPDQVELTYSFDLENRLLNLRVFLPGEQTHLPSISAIYSCAILYENEIHDLFDVEVEGLTVDFKGNFYKTAVKFPFGSTKAPCTTATPAVSSSKPIPAAATEAKK